MYLENLPKLSDGCKHFVKANSKRVTIKKTPRAI